MTKIKILDDCVTIESAFRKNKVKIVKKQPFLQFILNLGYKRQAFEKLDEWEKEFILERYKKLGGTDEEIDEVLSV